MSLPKYEILISDEWQTSTPDAGRAARRGGRGAKDRLSATKIGRTFPQGIIVKFSLIVVPARGLGDCGK